MNQMLPVVERLVVGVNSFIKGVMLLVEMTLLFVPEVFTVFRGFLHIHGL